MLTENECSIRCQQTYKARYSWALNHPYDKESLNLTVIQLKESFILVVSCQATVSFSLTVEALVPDTFEIQSGLESLHFLGNVPLKHVQRDTNTSHGHTCTVFLHEGLAFREGSVGVM